MINHLFVFIFVILTSLFSSLLSASEANKTIKIKELIEKYRSDNNFNGVVLIAHRGEILFEGAFGYSNFEKALYNNIDTKFRIGSLTKSFTAVLVLKLVQEGKVKLDSPISDYLHYYRSDTGDQVTIRHLLTHTSGIPSFTELPYFRSAVSRINYSVDEFTKRYCSDDLSFKPGTQFKYSNSGYFILGSIVEKVTGQSFARVLKEKILFPLGMNNTGFENNLTNTPDNMATGYQGNLGQLEQADYINMSVVFSAGAMYSTARDLLLWDRALYTEKILKRNYIEQMFEQSPVQNYGLGWSIDMIGKGAGEKQLKNVTHTGAINGFRSKISRIIDDEYLIVLLQNWNKNTINEVHQGVIDILYQQSTFEPFNKQQGALFGKWILAKKQCPLKYKLERPRYNDKFQKYQFPYKVRYYGNGSVKIQYQLGNDSGSMLQTVSFEDRSDDKNGISIGFKSPQILTLTHCKILY
ncbi:serine hydrolase domain-containing protein [Thalassotalea marina]|uniref:Beta-lactamase-related domain-containing protein n=1 Tax=Thalassotalea marina TaxID=1673741 RepID=A0A919BKL4_9GAMM|nr:serine hydrolase domain-containing protein [Thalassotalea marina]GHF96424.1 hypothetical protein GCM10017161_25980 [Thalassotalea marina]